MTMWTSPFSASYPFFVIISLTNCVGTAIKCDLRISLVVLYVHAILSHLCWYSVSKLVWGTQRNEPCGLCCGHQWSVVFSYLFVIWGCQKIISNGGGGKLVTIIISLPFVSLRKDPCRRQIRYLFVIWRSQTIILEPHKLIPPHSVLYNTGRLGPFIYWQFWGRKQTWPISVDLKLPVPADGRI